MSSGIAQNYPYASEAQEERARSVEASLAAHPGLREKAEAESLPLLPEPRWWVWNCPTPDCDGLLHAAGYARDAHAMYVVCDTCGRASKR